MTNGEFAAWAKADPTSAARALLRLARDHAERDCRRSGGVVTDADDAASVVWMRASTDDWAPPRAHPDRRIAPTIRVYVRNVLREMRRARKRAGYVESARMGERAAPGAGPTGAVAAGELPDVPMTRKQRTLLRKVVGGDGLDAAARATGITSTAASARLKRVAAVAKDPERWARGHQRLELPAVPRSGLAKLSPRDRELLHWAHRPGATRGSVAKHLGVTPGTVKRRLSELRKSLGSRR